MKKIPFYKMQGSGNDFILIDNRRDILRGRGLSSLAQTLCNRHYSVGADGMIVIVRPKDRRAADFGWRFFNSDGSEAEMCGNGSRCAARFAFLNKIAGRKMVFETLAGLISAEVKAERVKVRLPAARDTRLDIKLNLDGAERIAHFINTGVPHVVYFSNDLDKEDVRSIGRSTRHHEAFRPAGTNVNFVQHTGPSRLRIRTYERGVEDETLACGTGSVAAALIAAALGKASSPVEVIPRSNERLVVSFDMPGSGFGGVYLEGEAKVICEGKVYV